MTSSDDRPPDGHRMQLVETRIAHTGYHSNVRSYQASEAARQAALGKRLLERFIARHAGGLGDKTYGVWDRALKTWHTPDKMTDTDADAETRAADLTAQHTYTGPRPPSDCRHLDPPMPIDIYLIKWEPVWLDYWVREPDGWYGHVLKDGCEPRWHPAERLRPRQHPSKGPEPS
jgi:hypothetical protein